MPVPFTYMGCPVLYRYRRPNGYALVLRTHSSVGRGRRMFVTPRQWRAFGRGRRKYIPDYSRSFHLERARQSRADGPPAILSTEISLHENHNG